MTVFWNVARILEEGVGPVFPSAVATVLYEGQVVFEHAVGDASVDTIYDLASLTKPMVCATAYAQSRVQLDRRSKHLLGHTFGMPAHIDLVPTAAPGSAEAVAEIKARVMATKRVASVGTAAIYSDLGYMILGWHLEDRLGCTLDELFSRIASSFGLNDTCFRPQLGADPTELVRIAPTEDCPVRGRVVRGEVHDLNCWYLGGVAGHAGLFGTARDVGSWAQQLLDAYLGRPAPADERLVQVLWRTPAMAFEPTTWRLGFDSPTPGASSAGRFFDLLAVGHLGFTGTSVWVDPMRELVCILLSNRVHPRAFEDPAIKRLRPAFHDAIVRALGRT